MDDHGPSDAPPLGAGPQVSGRTVIIVGGLLFAAVIGCWYALGERIQPMIEKARQKEAELGRKLGPEDSPKRKPAR